MYYKHFAIDGGVQRITNISSGTRSCLYFPNQLTSRAKEERQPVVRSNICRENIAEDDSISPLSVWSAIVHRQRPGSERPVSRKIECITAFTVVSTTDDSLS